MRGSAARSACAKGHRGGGATYILPGLVEANESSIPILAINTDVSVSSRGHFTLTELDQRALMKPLTKWNAVLDRSVDIPRIFRQAFEADDHRPSGRGAHRAAVRRAERPGRAQPMSGPTRRSVRFRRAGSHPTRPWWSSPPRLLREAKNPLFICGGGVVLSGAEGELATRGKPVCAGRHHHQRQGLDRRALLPVGGRGRLERRHARDARGGRCRGRGGVRRLPRRLGDHRALAPSGAGQGAHHPYRRRPRGAGHQLQGRRAARRRCAALPRRSERSARGLHARRRPLVRRSAEAGQIRKVRGLGALGRHADQPRTSGFRIERMPGPRCHRRRRSGDALPIPFRLLRGARHRPALFLQPRARRARLCDGGVDGRARRRGRRSRPWR